MTIYVSSANRAFYSDEFSLLLPADAQAIPDELHEHLLEGQSQGQVIDFSQQTPCLVDSGMTWPSVDELFHRIDDYVAFAYAAWVRFEPEYAAREKAASAYREAGYEGDGGGWITHYAAVTGLQLKGAADLILDKAVQRRDALEALAGIRLRKQELLSLDGEVRQARYQEFVDKIQSITALLDSFERLLTPDKSIEQLS